MKRARDPRVWLGLVVTALFLWLALRDVSFAEVGKAIAQANWLLTDPTGSGDSASTPMPTREKSTTRAPSGLPR